MVAIACVKTKDHNQISLHNQSVNNTFDKNYEIPLEVPVHLNLSSRKELTDATISNLLSIGILLPSEIDRYRTVLTNYDYGTLVRVFIYSNELKYNQR